MSPQQRRDVVRGAFRVPAERKAEVKGRRIVLVDDVYTSGATANGCARVLKRAGAAEVQVLRDQVDCRLDVANGPDGALYFTNFSTIARITR